MLYYLTDNNANLLAKNYLNNKLWITSLNLKFWYSCYKNKKYNNVENNECIFEYTQILTLLGKYKNNFKINIYEQD